MHTWANTDRPVLSVDIHVWISFIFNSSKIETQYELYKMKKILSKLPSVIGMTSEEAKCVGKKK